MLETIAIAAVVLTGALLAFAATKPHTFRLQRSITINAPPEKIFSLINDFKSWVAWSPWEKMDPALKRTYSGAAQGQRAVYEWNGNNQVGQGRMEITESAPSSRIKIQLDFFKPFEAHNTAEFSLAGRDGSTNVTWAMYGPQPFMMRIMGVFCSPERMVGPQFETGLASLKTISEK